MRTTAEGGGRLDDHATVFTHVVAVRLLREALVDELLLGYHRARECIRRRPASSRR